VGYTNPKSTSQGLSTARLTAAGLRIGDAKLVKTGGFGEGVAALDVGLIDIAPMPEPLVSKFEGKLRAPATAEHVLPALNNVIGAATMTAMETQGEKLRAILRARRTAVKFIYANPNEAAAVLARVHRMDPNITRKAVNNLVRGQINGVGYWGEGGIRMGSLQRMLKMQEDLGTIALGYDIKALIDTSFLPEDMREPDPR
jgi:NitT/TauT family transport system substrate-binding protein